jgi:tetratricopeptide (TPR) repeat protein
MTANKLGQENCSQCGTPLMLIVKTPAVRYDMSYSQTHGQEFLLERISWLELRVMQLVGKLEQVLNLMLQQSNNIFFNHTLLDALVTILTKDETINVKELNDLWKANRDKKEERKDKLSNVERLKIDWIFDYKGNEKKKFEELIDKAIELFSNGDFKKGIRGLERASAISPDNVSLNMFLGVSHFRDGKTAIASDYFQRIYSPNSKNDRIALLLALTHCEEGKREEAKKILTKLTRQKNGTFAAHYAMGRLLIIDEKWSEAIAHFKKALAIKPSAEAHYILASAYYAVEKFELAENHLFRAIEADKNFADCFYLLGLVILLDGREQNAMECFNLAAFLNPEEKAYQSAISNIKRLSKMKVSPPLFATLKMSKKRLISSGDKRISNMVWKDALGEKDSEIENKDRDPDFLQTT